eukprot:IDg2266t1
MQSEDQATVVANDDKFLITDNCSACTPSLTKNTKSKLPVGIKSKRSQYAVNINNEEYFAFHIITIEMEGDFTFRPLGAFQTPNITYGASASINYADLLLVAGPAPNSCGVASSLRRCLSGLPVLCVP